MTKKAKAGEQPVAGADVEKAVDQLLELPDQVNLDLKTARGDLRDALLEAFRNRPKLWSQMSQFEQRDVATALNTVAEQMITKVARVLATAGHKVVSGTLDGLTIKDGMKITIKAPMTHEAIDVLAEATGKQVLVCRVMDGVAMGQRKESPGLPDEPSLIPDDDSDLLGDTADHLDKVEGQEGEGAAETDPDAQLADPSVDADQQLAGDNPPFDAGDEELEGN